MTEPEGWSPGSWRRQVCLQQPSWNHWDPGPAPSGPKCEKCSGSGHGPIYVDQWGFYRCGDCHHSHGCAEILIEHNHDLASRLFREYDPDTETAAA